MDSFDQKVAVITGGASGMGRAFAERFGSAGCQIVIADVEASALETAVAELKAAGIAAVGIKTDVSKAAEMTALSDRVLAEFGQVNLLFNNAGVGGGGALEDLSLQDWEWILGVNLWGVIHGLNAFYPHMLAHGDGHIVNTASVAGMTSYPNMAPYNASKHAVVTISETIYAELAEKKSSLGISCLCPGIVRTNIFQSERNRPEHLRRPFIPPQPDADQQERFQLLTEVYAQAVQPPEVAELVFQAVVNNQFYIWTDPVYAEPIRERHHHIDHTQNPNYRGGLLDEDQSR